MNYYSRNIEFLRQQSQINLKDHECSIPVEILYSKEEHFPILRISKSHMKKTLNSAYSVDAEIKRWISHIKQSADAFIVIGIGTSLQVLELSNRYPASSIFVIEPDLSFLNVIFETYDLTDFFSRHNIQLFNDASELSNYLLSGIHMTVSCLVSPGYLSVFPQSVQTVTNITKKLIDDFVSDSATQKAIGRFLFKNTVSNLKKLMSISISPNANEKARILVAGGGPSLRKITEVYNTDDFLIAADTSLPFLYKNGIIPDIIMGIDSRNVSYLSYVGTDSSALHLIDIGYPSFITRKIKNKIFITGNFPFASFIDREAKCLPKYNSSPGNVGSICLQFASYFKPLFIHAFGMDFAYPNGDLYVVDSYFYNHFSFQQNRINTFLSGTTSFLCKYDLNYNEKTKSYSTPLMQKYKAFCLAQMGSLGYELLPDGTFRLKSPITSETGAISFSNAHFPESILTSYITSCKKLKNRLSTVSDVSLLTVNEQEILRTLTPLLLQYLHLPAQERVNHAVSDILAYIAQ